MYYPPADEIDGLVLGTLVKVYPEAFTALVEACEHGIKYYAPSTILNYGTFLPLAVFDQHRVLCCEICFPGELK